MYKKAERDVGFQAGRTEGELIKLISQVRKKKTRNQTRTKTAEDLLEEADIVNAIYDLLEADTSMTDDMIYSKIKK